MKTNKHELLSFLLFATLTLNLMAAYSASCSESTRIYLEPSDYLFDASTVTVGTLFNVTVKVENIDDMKTWQLKMSFNDSIINVTRWYEPKSDPTYVFYGKTTMPVPFPPDVKYQHVGPNEGWVAVGAVIFPSPSPGGGFTGNGLLCIIQFNVTELPPAGEEYTSAFDIEWPSNTFWMKAGETVKRSYDTYENGHYRISSPAVPYDVTINAYCFTEEKEVNVNIKKDGGFTGYTTPHTFTSLTGTHTFTVPVTDPSGHLFMNWSTGETSTTITVSSSGTYTANYEEIITVGTRLYVDPPEIIDPSILPSSTLDINITVDDITNMLSCEFNLTYNPEVLQWIGIRTFKVLGQTPTAQVTIDDQVGYIWVKLTYETSISTSTPAPLVKVSFHVEALGSSVLDLNDTELLDPTGEPIEHETVDGFFMSLIRDVAIVEVVPSRSWAYPGWQVNITATAKNLGNISETFDVEFYYNDSIIEVVHIADLASNTEKNITITWDTSGLEEGFCTIKAEATTVPYEYNVTNNVYVDGTVQILTVIRDVAVINVLPEPIWAYQGWIARINVTVKNLGEMNETFDVIVSYDSNVIDTFHVVDLEPSAELVLEYHWDTSTIPCHNYTIKAEATTVPYEYNVTNNVYVDGILQVRLLGDVNGDGIVDMLDIAVEIDAFMTYPGHPLWNPEADLDRSGTVDMVDLSIVITNFQKSCPP